MLLRNRDNLTREQDRIRLAELLSANRSLAKAYILKEGIKDLWRYTQINAANEFWKSWYRQAIYSKVEPLKTFARRLKEKIDDVLAHCKWPFNTSLLEGINNKIKVIKRMAYGFRDDEYFFLKIRAAFPRNPR